ncbi:HU family DNA-binding protein [Parabacteroides distasonis]|nr:HU family DNA-binding protein [Parabacteroides distasonis]
MWKRSWCSSNGSFSMKTLCKLISTCSRVSLTDVKAVLDSLNFVLDMELQEGHVVKLGDFGSFQISVSSDGVIDKKNSIRVRRVP